MNLQTIADAIDGQVVGDASLEVSSLRPLSEAHADSLSLILDNRFVDAAQSSEAKAFVSFSRLEGIDNQIVVKNPRDILGQLIELFFPESIAPLPCLGISDRASVAEDADIGEGSTVSDFCTIGSGTRIGKGSYLYPNVTVGRHCVIGENCVIYPGVVIYDNSVIGDDFICHSNTVIGCDGFGYRQQQGSHVKIPHVGNVIIGDAVEIGANASIDRGNLGSTTIGNGTKIDNLVHIAHNTSVGEHCAITAQVGLIGSSTIGSYVMIGGQAGIAATLADRTVVAARSGVTKPTKAGQLVSGFPAQDHKKELKSQALIRKLCKDL